MPTVLGQVPLAVRVVDLLFQEFVIFKLQQAVEVVVTVVLFLVVQAAAKQEIIVLAAQQVVVIQVMILQDHCREMQVQLRQQPVVVVVTIHLLAQLLEVVKAD
jgi:hypothetical protein